MSNSVNPFSGLLESPSFLLSWGGFTSLSFLRDMCSRHRIFSFWTLDMPAHSLLPVSFLLRKAQLPYRRFPSMQLMLFSYWCWIPFKVLLASEKTVLVECNWGSLNFLRVWVFSNIWGNFYYYFIKYVSMPLLFFIPAVMFMMWTFVCLLTFHNCHRLPPPSFFSFPTPFFLLLLFSPYWHNSHSVECQKPFCLIWSVVEAFNCVSYLHF